MLFRKSSIFLQYFGRQMSQKSPFIDLYQKTTGEYLTKDSIANLIRKHPTIDHLTQDRLQCSLQILNKFSITALDACRDPHVFCMNPITMDNYGEILKECGFVNIIPKHIIRYHTLVRSRTIAKLKNEGLIRNDLKLEEVLYNHFQDWPANEKYLENFLDSNTSILTIRMSVLESYLRWRLSVTNEEFRKYCRNYLPLKHKPMNDIQMSLDMAQNELKFDVDFIKRNGFIIASDPVNTKLIIANVKSIAGIDIREVIKIEPAILKNNYNSLVKIRNLMEEYRISEEAQRRCFKVFCMCPNTVQERLNELRNLKEYQIFSSNPRVLSMVVHKRKMINRLNTILTAKKPCYSLNRLVSSNKVFNNYISSFGNKVCGRDIAVLITCSLQLHKQGGVMTNKELVKSVQTTLKKHKYWLNTTLNVVNQNVQFLKTKFNNDVIFNNCHLLLYPLMEIEQCIELLLKMRNGKEPNDNQISLDATYNNLIYTKLTDEQILSLVLYEIEKKYHFSGDGIWASHDGHKTSAQHSIS